MSILRTCFLQLVSLDPHERSAGFEDLSIWTHQALRAMPLYQICGLVRLGFKEPLL
jgi:hypothetical protein